MRVGANSPSLWPTIDSVTKTGTCLRPSWTAMVCPTMSGKIVEVRDQVLIICLVPASFIDSMRAIRRSSTNGPFFDERLTVYLPLLAAPAATDDVAVGRLALLARPVAKSRNAPRGHRMAPGGGGTLAAAVRVVDGVHGRAARLRADAHVTLAAGLADLDVLVIGVADRADRRAAVGAHLAHLAGRQAQGREVALLRHQLDGGAGGAAHLAAAAGLELDVVDDRAERHAGERQAVADRDLGVGAGHDRGADAQP